ncbi:MAG TPA: glycine/sarcosine/betaine reductase selenoprotein B family protein [Thermoanaerobaculia bacterium]|jgi:D-proline reductase (dithiol) PrdB|nr:glycine/sarcosine/betaine reductase selenoprotein B family protein [Thermoanaerobaculia bacterium]
MLNISRRCVPYTPFEKDLATAIVTLVSATGVYLPDQEPYPSEDPGDISYRIIPGTTEAGTLRIAHHHYDHSEADGDPNIVFPIDSLRELAAEGVIAGVNDKHYSYGFTTRLRDLYEQTFPELADKVERSRTKLVVLTAGCPETCHRSIGNLAREIEARGVPTVIISASPAATESVRPPRAMTTGQSEIGRIVGHAGDRATHKQVLRAALEMFLRDVPPGRVVSA